jgi:hypothetical protein
MDSEGYISLCSDSDRSFRLANELPGEKRLENLGNREKRDLPSLDETRSVSGKDLQAALDKNTHKFETFSKLGQIPPGFTMAEIDALTPAEIQARKPKPFGIDMGDGTVVSADKTLIAQANKEAAQKYAPAVSGARLIEIAEKLGHDPQRWEQTKLSPSPKCNQYVENVLRDASVPFPWKPGQTDCHGMRLALDKEVQSPNAQWDKVFAYDEKHGLKSDQEFTNYKPNDGDLMIWDGRWGNKYVQHVGITTAPGDILYAGSVSRSAPHGWRHGKIVDFTQSRDDYGCPTAVYRYRRLK